MGEYFIGEEEVEAFGNSAIRLVLILRFRGKREFGILGEVPMGQVCSCFHDAGQQLPLPETSSIIVVLPGIKGLRNTSIRYTLVVKRPNRLS